jgi:6-phosphofructokinase 2
MRILSIALNPTIDISSDVDHIQPTHKIRTFNQRRHPGGGGVNVARVIAELGGASQLLVLAGGATGMLLVDSLKDHGIELHTVEINEQTRIAFMVYEKASGLEYRFVPEGPVVSPGEIDKAFDILRGFRGDYVVASGSLPRGLAADTYARMADIAAENGVRFVLDTSGAALETSLKQSRVFLVKPSLGELEKLVGRSLDTANAGEAASELVRSGAANYVAVTMGRDGSILVGPDSVLKLAAQEVPVRSAVGAGDSFVGAMVWSLAEGHTIEEAFRLGSAAGAAAVLTPGTELCRRDDVWSLYEEARKRN